MSLHRNLTVFTKQTVDTQIIYLDLINDFDIKKIRILLNGYAPYPEWKLITIILFSIIGFFILVGASVVAFKKYKAYKSQYTPPEERTSLLTEDKSDNRYSTSSEQNRLSTSKEERSDRKSDKYENKNDKYDRYDNKTKYETSANKYDSYDKYGSGSNKYDTSDKYDKYDKYGSGSSKYEPSTKYEPTSKYDSKKQEGSSPTSKYDTKKQEVSSPTSKYDKYDTYGGTSSKKWYEKFNDDDNEPTYS